MVKNTAANCVCVVRVSSTMQCEKNATHRHVNGKYSETDKGERVTLVRPLRPISKREYKASE